MLVTVICKLFSVFIITVNALLDSYINSAKNLLSSSKTTSKIKIKNNFNIMPYLNDKIVCKFKKRENFTKTKEVEE
jgi:hypothetical protein